MQPRVRRRLEGEIAIVTGSTSGLGTAIAKRLSDEGAKVVVTGRDHERGRSCAEQSSSVFIPADLTSEHACGQLVSEVVRSTGPPTILVNTAVDHAIAAGDGPVTQTDDDVWHAMLDVVLVAAARLCRLVLPHMLEAGHGSIVHISSRTASRGTPGVSAYSSSKAGLEALARSVTIDYARRGIRCNVVQPGYILHPVRDAEMTSERRERYEAMHLTRIPTAEDIAGTVAFLASSEAEVITGITLPVDGGSSAVRGLTLG
jgi:NAD(P)-dependent dehydrogenase (short-subunit alcohol dehydrogenase family)